MHEKIASENLPDDIKQIIWITLAVFICMATFILFFLFLFNKRKNKLINDKLLMQAQHTEALLKTEIEIKEQTLKTISQEIHDNVGQVLSLAKLNLNTLDFDTGIPKEEKIQKSIQLVSKAINDLRELSKSLNGDKVADLGLTEAIANELQIIKNTGSFNTRFTVDGETCKLLPEVEMVMFRIVQESLNNAVKHSRAKNIDILISNNINQCSILITDDGEGFDVDKLECTETGIGLKNMQSRARLINAYFNIESAPGRGTRVILKTQA